MLLPMFAHGEVLSLDDALRETYTACVGIDDNLADLKKMAGINTAITGVGTGLGIGATAVGLIKEKKDKAKDELSIKLTKLRALESQNKTVVPSDKEVINYTQKFADSWQEAMKEIKQIEAEKQELDTQSKKLGNWRTGLLAGNTATNLAGAIIAGNNKVDDDLNTQIETCKSKVKDLQKSIMQAKMDGYDVSEAQTIYNTCREYDYVDVSKINNRATGAMVSSIVGTATGLSGTVTSAVANSDKTRSQTNEDGTRTDREKKLNTASNILAGASTVASATATVFNAAQIKAIKDVANVASKCTGVLK